MQRTVLSEQRFGFGQMKELSIGQQQQQQQQQGQQGQQPVPESPRSIPMSQDGIMASQPTSKHADELDGFIRAAGADGVELTDLYGL